MIAAGVLKAEEPIERARRHGAALLDTLGLSDLLVKRILSGDLDNSPMVTSFIALETEIRTLLCPQE